MSWGLFGPVRFRTKGGGRVTIFAIWMIAPSLALMYLRQPVEENFNQPNPASDLQTGHERNTDRGKDGLHLFGDRESS